MNNDELIFAISIEDLQSEAKERIGRMLTEYEIDIARKGFDYGLGTLAIDVIYNTIFTEMI